LQKIVLKVSTHEKSFSTIKHLTRTLWRHALAESHTDIHTITISNINLFLKDGDYIVRVSGRASPYNINRLTFYTAKGEKYGPWGDRRSEDSIDFDVTAPPGHGLAHFSGTVDFGVPFRSISFHWRPHE
jgi:hypothetical protein